MLKEAMYKRHSRRSYLREKLRDEDAAFLKERIHMYNQKHGLHMKLVCGHPEIFKGFRNSYGMFHNVENFIMMMGNSRDVYMQEKLGYFGERLIMEAVERNMGTCWVGGTFAKDALKPYVKEDEKLYCVIAIGYTARFSFLGASSETCAHSTAMCDICSRYSPLRTGKRLPQDTFPQKSIAIVFYCALNASSSSRASSIFRELNFSISFSTVSCFFSSFGMSIMISPL